MTNTQGSNPIQRTIFRFRVWLANKLVHIAFRIRPKEASQLMQAIQDQLMYGNGITRIDPKEFYEIKY